MGREIRSCQGCSGHQQATADAEERAKRRRIGREPSTNTYRLAYSTSSCFVTLTSLAFMHHSPDVRLDRRLLESQTNFESGLQVTAKKPSSLHLFHLVPRVEIATLKMVFNCQRYTMDRVDVLEYPLLELGRRANEIVNIAWSTRLSQTERTSAS